MTLLHRFAALALLCIQMAAANKGVHQVRLMRHLFDSDTYDRRVRPVRNESRPVRVRLRLNLYQLLDVNEPLQMVEMYTWTTLV